MAGQVAPAHSLRDDYWEEFQVDSGDIEFLYNHLLEVETPQTPEQLVAALIRERVRREEKSLKEKRSAGGQIYIPAGRYNPGEVLVFPAFDWQHAQVVGTRKGINPQLEDFDVIQVDFGSDEIREFASGLEDHRLNQPPDSQSGGSEGELSILLDEYGGRLSAVLLEELGTNPDFVYIAGRWFPRALVIEINEGHLNLAEAVLDMAGGGPLDTKYLIEQIGIQAGSNPNLLEFSLDLALQEDTRFDEVGPSGEVLWYLKKLEPKEVLQTPALLREQKVDFDRASLSSEMATLESELGDELSQIHSEGPYPSEVRVPLIFPHWHSGTLPISAKMQGIFPTAYDAPRIQIQFIDAEGRGSFPGWVVRSAAYVYGLKDWYLEKGLMPGSLVRVGKGSRPGEVKISTEGHTSAREYVRTALVGSDGGIVFAHLKQTVTAAIDDRMVISVPDPNALAEVWQKVKDSRIPFEKTVVDMFRELAKLTAQSHVHAIELYAAVNLVRRTPPGAIFALLESRPWFDHLGDFYFRMSDSEG